MNTNTSTFIPPHCPNPNCQYHKQLREDGASSASATSGVTASQSVSSGSSASTAAAPSAPRPLPPPTGSSDPTSCPSSLTKTTGCMANRQIARDLQVAPSTIDRQLGRLGRHCLLFHAEQMQDRQAGFRSRHRRLRLLRALPVLALPPPPGRRAGLRLHRLLHRQRGPPLRHHDPGPEAQARATRATARPARTRRPCSRT